MAQNIWTIQNGNPAVYERTLNHLIEETRAGRMFSKWNDYGRLLKY